MNAKIQAAYPDDRQYQKVARTIGQQLLKEAIWSGDCCTWTGDDMDQIEGKWKVVHKIVDPYQYSGLSGIARFLLELWKVTQDARYRNTIIACLKQTVRQLHKTEHMTPGLYNGVSGVIIVLLDAGRELDLPELTEAGLQLFNQTRDKFDIELPDSYDIIDGLAGILLGALYLEKQHQLDTFDISQSVAERIIADAVNDHSGSAWPVPGEGESLSGFAHGASGIAHALMAFDNRSQYQLARETALEAIRFENSLFEAEQNNWASSASLHSSCGDQSIKHQLNWCHGAAGIGLSRLHLYQMTGSDSFLADAGAAIQACDQYITLWKADQKNYQDNLSICHGYGSMAELFLYAYKVLGNEYYLDRAALLATRGLKARNGKFWPVGIPGGRETPGLMTGLAGIGWWYLMLSAPHNLSPLGLPCLTDQSKI